ncbi:MAG: hypothetical protein ACJAZ2_001967 [Glaciecola sp.]|jgi:hypothetical protein
MLLFAIITLHAQLSLTVNNESSNDITELLDYDIDAAEEENSEEENSEEENIEEEYFSITPLTNGILRKNILVVSAKSFYANNYHSEYLAGHFRPPKKV